MRHLNIRGYGTDAKGILHQMVTRLNTAFSLCGEHEGRASLSLEEGGQQIAAGTAKECWRCVSLNTKVAEPLQDGEKWAEYKRRDPVAEVVAEQKAA